ncbi:MAG: hypothetical protein PHW63_06010 [Alphaproteobacteria bacterium]|nr:hypothetical protein [Alphaproteobacteria bacterium]
MFKSFLKQRYTVSPQVGDQRVAWFFSFVFILFAPDTAWASSFGQIICNARLVGSGYLTVLNAGSFIVGLFLAVRGVLLLKLHAENPNSPQVTKAVAHLMGGGLMMSLPEIAGVLQRSLFTVGSGAGNFGCTPGATGTAVSLDVMMQNFVKNIYAPVSVLVALLGGMVGAYFIAKGLLSGAKVGSDPRAGSPKTIITHLVIGAILISLSTMLPSVISTLFGSSATVSNVSSFTGIQWSKFVGTGVSVDAINKTTQAILAFIQLIGLIAFLRGWLIVKTAIDGGQATIPQGITHIVAGAMAVNIDLMLNVIDETFGTGLVN